MEGMQPGQVIVPQSNGGDGSLVPNPVPVSPSPPSPAPPVPVRPEQEPGENPPPTPRPAPLPEPINTTQPEANFTYTPASTPSQPAYIPAAPVAYEANSELPGDISWTASEFIEHQKSFMWYGALGLGGLAAAVLAYVVTRDVITTGVIIFAATVFGVYAARKPRTQQYSLTRQGVQIGGRLYNFAEFKNFSVATEGAIASIVFMPLRRFMPSLTIYVAPDMEDRVVDFLSEILPFEQHRADAVDSLLRKVRF